MSSEDEMDDFEVSDYDMLGALGKLKRPKRTKEDAIYGVWADTDDRPSFQQARTTKKEDYTKNIMNSFVSGGTKAGSKPPAPKEEYDSSDNENVLDPNDDTYEKEYL